MKRTRGQIKKIARQVVADYFSSTGDPDSWFPHKYTPIPPELVLIQRSVPVGDLALLKTPGAGLVKSPEVNRYEIEMALRESGAYAKDIDRAMGLLPNMDAFYQHLESKGLHKQVRLIRALLEW